MSDPQSFTYTPTVDVVSNLDSVIVREFRAMQVGDCFVVDGTVGCVLTSVGTPFSFDVSLPVATSFGSQWQASGGVFAATGITGVGLAEPTSVVRFTCDSPAGSSGLPIVTLHFSYRLQGP